MQAWMLAWIGGRMRQAWMWAWMGGRMMELCRWKWEDNEMPESSEARWAHLVTDRVGEADRSESELADYKAMLAGSCQLQDLQSATSLIPV